MATGHENTTAGQTPIAQGRDSSTELRRAELDPTSCISRLQDFVNDTRRECASFSARSEGQAPPFTLRVGNGTAGSDSLKPVQLASLGKILDPNNTELISLVQTPKTPELPVQIGPLGTPFVPVESAQESRSTISSVYDRVQDTKSGRKFHPDEMTCAIKPSLANELGLKVGDVLRVTHNGKTVDVVYTDAGPFVKDRGMDLSTAAGRAIGITEEDKGIGKVSFEKKRQE